MSNQSFGIQCTLYWFSFVVQCNSNRRLTVSKGCAVVLHQFWPYWKIHDIRLLSPWSHPTLTSFEDCDRVKSSKVKADEAEHIISLYCVIFGSLKLQAECQCLKYGLWPRGKFIAKHKPSTNSFSPMFFAKIEVLKKSTSW